MSSPYLPEKGFGYAVKYGSNEDDTTRSRHDSIDMDSSHELVSDKKSECESVSSWPLPNTVSNDSHYSHGSNLDDDSQDEEGLASCLCYGFTVLGDLLCNMYSENDSSKQVHMNRSYFQH